MDLDTLEEQESVTPTKYSRRRSTARQQENGATGTQETATPTRNVRSSGRQRKVPIRYGDEVMKNETPRPSKDTTTPIVFRSTPSTRSARGSITKDIGSDVAGDESSPAPETTLSSRRSKRATVKFNTRIEKSNDTSQESSIDPDTVPNGHGLDDTYDPVAAQLQQDLIQDVDAHDEPMADAEPLPDYAEQFQKLCGDLREELGTLSKVILEKLNGKRLVPIKGLQTEYQKTYQLVEQTVTAGEGNSMLLMGSRGCGKTAVIETVLSCLSKSYEDDFHVVRLNGFLHTDDRLALREIWRQLGRETHTEDEASKINSYADTMATLLALLSHPEELFGNPENPDAIATAKSVVIVLDEFDLFAAHPRQTLLYNLFDIAQARKAPLAVIGLTTKVDIMEALEKRVKSRFSHRYVFLPLAKTFDIFSEICFAGLRLEEAELGEYGLGSGLGSAKGKQLVDGWNNYLKGLWNDKELQYQLRLIYHQTKSVKDFWSSALLPLSDLYHSSIFDGELEIPTPRSFTSQPLTCPDPAPLPFSPTMTGSASSTSLPLSLLLAATRLTALHDPGLDTANPQALIPLALSFPAAYAEYVRLLTSAKANASASGAAATPGRVWGRDVSREAWEKLVSWGVVVPLGLGNGTTDGRMFRVEVSFEEVAEMVGAGGALGRWWREG